MLLPAKYTLFAFTGIQHLFIVCLLFFDVTKYYELQLYGFKISVCCGLFEEIGLTFTFA